MYSKIKKQAHFKKTSLYQKNVQIRFPRNAEGFYEPGTSEWKFEHGLSQAQLEMVKGEITESIQGGSTNVAILGNVGIHDTAPALMPYSAVARALTICHGVV